MVSHDRDFIYKPRSFESSFEHDEAIIKRWNSVVNPEDEVYVLGDIMLGNNIYGLKCLKSLKGKLHIIFGNHDTDTRKQMYSECYNVVDCAYANLITFNKWKFFLSHYPTLTANNDDDGKPISKKVINLCGHIHTKDPFYDWERGLIYHCEMDAHNCTPILLEDIIEDIKKR